MDEEIKTFTSLLRKLKAKVQEEGSAKEAKVDPDLINPRKITSFLRRENFYTR